MDAPRWSRLLVALQLAALVVLAGVTAQRFHVWATVDEEPHYAYVQTVAEQGRLPLLDDLVSPEVQAITDRTWPRPSPRDPSTLGLGGRSYEAFQPPLYYLAAAPAFAIAGDHRTKIKVVRLFDALLLLAAAGLLWRLARAVMPRTPLLGLAAGLVVLLWPGVIVRAVTVSPSALEIVLVLGLSLALWRVQAGAGRRWLLGAGALLGACLLTKTTLVYLAPLTLMVVALDWRRRRDTLGAVLALALPVLALAPWLAFNHAHYGSLMADEQARAQQRSTLNPSNREYGADDAVHYTRRLFDHVLPEEWRGQLGEPWVRIVVLAVDVALFGAWLVLALTRRRGPPARRLWFFGAPVLTGYLVMLAILLAENWPTFNLRYLYPALPGLALAVAAALPVRRAWIGVAACSVLVAALWIDMAGAFYFSDLGRAVGITPTGP